MEDKVAGQLIAEGADLAHVRLIGGPYMACHTRYNPDFTDRCHNIPSWVWVKDGRYFRVHYLDLPLLEATALKAGYELRYAPEVTEHLKKLRAEYLERREWKKGEPRVTIPVKRPLRNYQVVGAQFMYKAQRVLNADGMGSGKTAQTIGAVVLNKEMGRGYKTLVTCPSSVKFAWANEFAAMTDLKVLVLDKSMNKRYEQYEFLDQYDVVIVAYDGFMSDYEELARLFKPDIFVMDEAHRMCNRTNKITQILIGGKNVRKTFPLMCDLHSVYLLSGTPITNKLEDLYTILKLIDPGLFSWTGFTNRYCVMEDGYIFRGGMRRSFKKIAGYRNEAELKAKLSLYMVRRTKDEVLPELPDKIYQTIEVELGEEERRVYNELKKDFKTTVRGKDLTVMDKLSWLTRAQQICDSLELVPGSTAKKSSKLEELVRIVNEQVGEHKIVVFSKYKTMTDIICREMAQLKPLSLHGDVESADRQVMVNEFQTNPKRRLFVSTLGAGGVGITLTAADIVIFYDQWWSPALNNQAADRLHRIGQKNSVNVVTLRVRNSVEEHVAKTWIKKQGIISDMVGDELVISKMTESEMEGLL